MGIYSEYLDRAMDFPSLSAERKKQLGRIAALRKRDVLVVAADLSKPTAPISIHQTDLLPIKDQVSNLSGEALDLILETPGGSGEVAEDIVRFLHGRYKEVAVIVPGCAKSAGTIIAMAGDEILMDGASSLGPIDAQLQWQGKVFSAEALLEGMEKIKRDVTQTGVLNKAYIPMLQGISPGELQSAENALKFAESLVTDWLVRYKFKNWTTHSSTGKQVTEEEKKARANDIARELRNHSRWLTHGRSLKMHDLAALGLRITDYSKMPDLNDAIVRYHTLLQMTFETNIYKVFETPSSNIYRFVAAQQPQQQMLRGPAVSAPDVASIGINCGRCSTELKVQANLGRKAPLQQGHVPFPKDNRLRCPSCGNTMDLTGPRLQIEAQTKKKVVP